MAMYEKCIESERPDFVFLSNETVIGLEHFLVDSMYNQQEKSHSRQRNANIKHAVDNYAKHQDSVKKRADSYRRNVIMLI